MSIMNEIVNPPPPPHTHTHAHTQPRTHRRTLPALGRSFGRAAAEQTTRPLNEIRRGGGKTRTREAMENVGSGPLLRHYRPLRYGAAAGGDVGAGPTCSGAPRSNRRHAPTANHTLADWLMRILADLLMHILAGIPRTVLVYIIHYIIHYISYILAGTCRSVTGSS